MAAIYVRECPVFARIHGLALAAPARAPNRSGRLHAAQEVSERLIYKVDRAGGIRQGAENRELEAPDGNRNTLVLEIMGKHSNMILLSDTGKILGAIKHVGSSVSRAYRQVLPGRDYMPPPGGTKENPIEISQDKFDELWRDF